MTPTEGLRVAFIGAGGRGLQTAAILEASGLGHPVAFWDRREHRRDAAGARFGARSYSDITRMIETERPDLVAVVTHPEFRSEPIALAVAAGARALLVEKPLALTASELERVEAASAGAFVAVNTQYQWMPHWQRILGMLSGGELGPIRQVRASTGVDILEQGPHLLSLALAGARAARLGEPEWILAGSGADVAGTGAPVDLVAVLGLGDARLSLTAGPSAPEVPGESVIHFQQQVEFSGDLGQAWVSLNQGARLTIDGRVEHLDTAWPRDDGLSQTALFRELAAAIPDAALQASFPTRLEIAARETRVLLATIEAAASGRRLTLG